MMEFFDLITQVIVCVTPLIVAWFGYQASKNEKQTKSYLESQEELKKANEKIKANERQELEKHFDRIDNSIGTLTKQIENLEKSMSKISEIDKRIDNLVEMSNVNFEFCTSLSAVISSIGNALDSSECINSETLQDDIVRHRKKERELVNKAVKIVY